MYHKQIVEASTFKAFCDNCEAAINEMGRAYELIESAHNRLKPFVGDYPAVLPDGGIKSLYRDTNPYQKETEKNIKKQAWDEIAKRLQVFTFMTEKRKEEFYKFLDGDLPTPTIEAIQNFYLTFAEKVNSLMDETINEAFETLRPRNSKHKTNSEYEIPKKVIWKTFMDWPYYVPRYTEQRLIVVDNVFHLLDGKGIAKHPETLPCIINTALRENRTGNPITTEYFRIKVYCKSGTVHIEFLRPDLLAKLNAAGGGNRLRKS